MGVGLRRLLQHYWYKVPVLHIIKYHFMGVGYRYSYWYKPNPKMGSKLKKRTMGIDSQDIYPRPPRLLVHESHHTHYA